MADDSLSYFSSLESSHTRVSVAPVYQPPESTRPVDNVATAGNFTAQTSESNSENNPTNQALREDKYSLSDAAKQLSADDLRLIQKLAQRDRTVKAHEAAHLAAAGRYARGGANFTYQRGPNGVNYAIGGDVTLDTSTPSDPEQALAKAQQIRAAALAPAQPSTQDRTVAAQATQAANQARVNIAAERAEETAEKLEQAQEDNTEARQKEIDETGNVADSEPAQQAQTRIQEYQNNAANDPETEDRNLLLSLKA
ncbi:MAG: catalase [Gammaproteobacteria bacterium]|nr:catalase [Gammaproteobacteria bacterium]